MKDKNLSRRWFLRTLACVGSTAALVGGGMISVNSLAVQSTEADPRKIKYGMVIDNSKCVGCGLCQQACRERWGLQEGEEFIKIHRDYVRGDVHSQIVELPMKFPGGSFSPSPSSYCRTNCGFTARCHGAGDLVELWP